MKVFMLMVLMGLMACDGEQDGGDDDAPAAVCGDGVCAGGETATTCPNDCGGGAACTGNMNADDTCTGDNVCVGGRCVAAFGRRYRVVIGTGQLQQNNAAGETWDVPGGLPDAFVDVMLDGQSLGATPAVQDTLTPAWNVSTETNISAGSTIVLSVYDEDVAANDFMFGCQLQPITAQALRSYALSCPSFAEQPAGVGSEVVFWFEPL